MKPSHVSPNLSPVYFPVGCTSASLSCNLMSLMERTQSWIGRERTLKRLEMFSPQVMNNLLEVISVLPVLGRSENIDDDYETIFKHQK